MTVEHLTEQHTEHRTFTEPDETRAFQMADGTRFDAHPGAVTSLTSGPDAWVVGDDEVVVIDWFGAGEYAK